MDEQLDQTAVDSVLSAKDVREAFEQTRPQRDVAVYEPFLRAVVQSGASDLHLKSGRQPQVRINGKLHKVEREVQPNEVFEARVLAILNEAQRAQLLATGSVDFAYELEGNVRFRVNVYRQESGLSLAARVVSRTIPSFEKLNLPPVIQQIADYRQGLVLVAGVTGSGKSTTIAAMLEHINSTRHEHIITIEDPIEFLYTEKKCLINQREIGLNVKDHPAALRALVREDPDVVLIGELRDVETFKAAIQTAETGHMVFGTVHAANPAQAIGRLLELFPHEERDLVRQSLVFNLRAIIAQRLVPSCVDSVGRVPAVEVMISTPIVQKLLAESRETELMDVIRAGEEGMQSFTESLYRLYEQQLITAQSARLAAPNPQEFDMRMKGIQPSSGRITS
jgi:twitching motility protein PilT